MKHSLHLLLALLLLPGAALAQKQWVRQPTVPTDVPRILGISMFDTSRGVAVGAAALGSTPAYSGVLIKEPGSPTWVAVDPAMFTPPLPASFPFFAGVHAVPGTSTCYIGGTVITGVGNSLYRSDDYGHTWVLKNVGMGNQYTIYDIDFRSATEGMTAGAGGYLHFTSDGGDTWPVPFRPVMQNLHGLKHAPGTMDWWMVGENKSVVRLTWPPGSTVQFVGSFPGNTTDNLEGVHPVDAVTVFFGVNTNVNRTTNWGANFTVLPPITPTPSTINAVWFFDANTGWVAGSYTDLYHTTDCGAHWTRHVAVPGGGSGSVARLVFPDTGCGYACGPRSGAVGWILRYGEATSPDISSSDTLADFGTLTCDSSAIVPVTITSSGTDTLRIGLHNVTLPAGFSLSPPDQLPIALAPGSSTTITVRWTPLLTRADTIPAGSFMEVTSNDGVHSPWKVRLSGIRNFARLLPSQTALVFPATCVGGRSEISIPATALGNLPVSILEWTFVSGNDEVALVSPSTGSATSGPLNLVFRFSPLAKGPRSGRYTLVAGLPACPDSIVFTFTGTGTSPSFRVIDTLRDFGLTCPGDTVFRRIYVVNMGVDSFEVQALDFDSGMDRFQCVTTLPATGMGDSVRLTIRFTPGPGDIGVITGHYRVKVRTSGGCMGDRLVTFTGVCQAADIVVAPNPVDLGLVVVGMTDSAVVTVANNGIAAVNLTLLRLVGAPAALTLSGAPAMPHTLSSGESFQIVVRCTPVAEGGITATLELRYDSPCNGVRSIPVMVTGTAPPHARIDTTLNHGRLLCGLSMLDTLMVRNSGPGPLVLGRFEITGPQHTAFTVVAPMPPAIIQSGDSLRVVIEFAPVIDGVNVATLTIHHNDATTNFVSTVALSGVYERVDAVVEGDTLSPFEACITTTQTRRLVLRNTGTATIHVMSIAVTRGAPEFHLDIMVFPVLLAPGDSLPVTVRFTPSSPDVTIGAITFRFDPCGESLVVTLTGVGRQQLPQLTPVPVDFGTVQVGAACTRFVRIANPGPLPMRVARVFFQPSLPELTIAGTPSPPFVIPAGSSASVQAVYTPTAVGRLTAISLCVEVDDPCPGVVCVAVRGEAASSGLGLDRRDLVLTFDPCAPATVCDTVRITNHALIPHTVSAMRIDPPGSVFRITGATPLPAVMDPGASMLLTICADPFPPGSRPGRLIVETNDPGNPQLTVDLAATRDSAGIMVHEVAIDFGQLTHCLSAGERIITVTNTGTLPDSVRVAALPDPSLSIVTPLPLALNPGETRSIVVRYAPAADDTLGGLLWLEMVRCGWRIPVEARGAYRAQGTRVSPSPLDFAGVNIGQGLTRPATFTNDLAVPVRIARVEIQPVGPFTSEVMTPMTVDSGATATLALRFTPVATGAASARALVILDQPCADTIVLLLTGTGVNTGLVFHSPELRFGATAQCEAPVLTDTLVNTGALPFTLTGSSITGAAAGMFTVLNPVSGNETLAGGALRVFTIRFTPGTGTDGMLTAALRVSTTDAFHPAIDLPLSGQRMQQRTPADLSVPVGSVPLGVETLVQVTLTNTGARPVTYTAADLPADVTLTPPPPITVPAGGSTQVQVGVTPRVADAFAITALLTTDTPCTDTTRITLTGTAAAGSHQTDAVFGITAVCEQPRRSITLVNGEGAAIEMLGVSIAGTDAADFAVIAPTAFPITVPAGDSVTIVVEYRPGTAPALSTAQCISTIRRGGSDVDVWSTLSGRTEPALLTAAALPLDAGQAPVGTPVQARLPLINTTPFTIGIATADMTTMVVTGTTPALPATLAPGDTLWIDVMWTPGVGGTVTDSLVLDQRSPCVARPAFAATGTGLPSDVLLTDLSIPGLEGRIDEHILIPVESSTDLGAAGVRSWEGTITFNRTMLYPLSVVTAGTLSQDMDVQMSYEHRTGTVFLTASGAEVRAGAMPLVQVECLVLLGDSLQTPLTPGSAFIFTSGRARVQSRTSGVFHLIGYCMGEGNRLVRIDGAYHLRQNHPNPCDPTTTISYEIAIDGPVRLTMHDVLGREIAVPVDAVQHAGMHTVTVDVRGLQPGVYFYRLVSGSYRATRRMVVGR